MKEAYRLHAKTTGGSRVPRLKELTIAMSEAQKAELGKYVRRDSHVTSAKTRLRSQISNWNRRSPKITLAKVKFDDRDL